MNVRTTLILEDQTMIALKELAARESRTLTEIVAETLDRGLGRRPAGAESRPAWSCASFDMGGGFDYSSAWDRIDALEADSAAEKLELRK